VAAAHKLQGLGEPCHLTILGMKIPDVPRVPYIETIGYLDKNDPRRARELCAIFDRSHLLFLASAADASPMVLSEAACHGLPAVTRAVGGIPTLVEHGVTGLVLPRDADARAFALAIRDLANEEGAIERMSRAARVRFENTLNWTSWASGIVAALEASGPHNASAEAGWKRVSTE
jgi:glycosyltransferase involved in cell wall biosynthesis